jgi:WD40 repeat protein
MAFSPASNLFAHGQSTEVLVWDLGKDKEYVRLYSIDYKSDMHCLLFSPDGKRLAMAGQKHGGTLEKPPPGDIRVWDIAARKVLLDVPGVPSCCWMEDVAFAPDGKRLASGHEAGILKLWEAASGKELQEHQGLFDKYSAPIFTSSGRLFAIGHWDDATWLADIDRHKRLFCIGPRYKSYGYLSPDGKRLVSKHRDKLEVWDVEDRAVKLRRDWPDDSWIQRIAPIFGQHRLQVVVCNCTKVYAWDPEKNEVLWTITRRDFGWKNITLNSITVSPDGRWLAVDLVHSAAMQIELWKLPPPD